MSSDDDRSELRRRPASRPEAPGPADSPPLQALPAPEPELADSSRAAPLPGPTESVPPRTPIPKAGSQPGFDNRVRIGLWGSPGSGKTTVISALPIAAQQRAAASRNWVVTGVGDSAIRFLTEGVNRLNDGNFPSATDKGVVTSLTWSLQGPDEGAHDARPSLLRRRARTNAPALVERVLDLQDVSGEAYNHENPDPRVVENLALSSGLVYLFDPIFESEADLKSFTYFYTTLQMVAARVRDERRMQRGRLPHHVAVLVTKFDDPRFFEAALAAGWVNQPDEPPYMPYVPVEQGPRFFDWVCRQRHGGSAELVQQALNTFFHPDHVEYFACSAVGFRLNPNGEFDYKDYSNVDSVDDKPRIRSLVRPVNILEPMIRLERRIRARV